MWMIEPECMCKQHIVGEHGEIHKFRHNFVKRHNISGRLTPVVQIQPSTMQIRHDELANYLNHNSPYELPDLSYLSTEQLSATVDIDESYVELSRRCSKCRELIKQKYGDKYVL